MTTSLVTACLYGYVVTLLLAAAWAFWTQVHR